MNRCQREFTDLMNLHCDTGHKTLCPVSIPEAGTSKNERYAKFLLSDLNRGPLLKQLDPCSPAEAGRTPAFRMGGPQSLPLSTLVLREVMRTVAEKTLGPDWSAFDYGAHSLRIGRENGLRAADLRPELINDISNLTPTWPVTRLVFNTHSTKPHQPRSTAILAAKHSSPLERPSASLWI